ncbi:Reverse transcriptase zinc-binding domain-containing protein [Hirschfeldia incana]|nr:Reverse transcriptase zinc-binding domain-containing protein [Hirschfeldia incana]
MSEAEVQDIQQQTGISSGVLPIRKVVHNGETTYFWSTNWTPYGKLSLYLPTAGTARFPVRANTTLAELWENGAWNLPSARSDRQLQLLTFLSSITLNDYNDEVEWWPGSQRKMKFRTGDIYHLLRPSAPLVHWHKEVWFSGGIPKHMFLVWLMVRNRCPTRDRMLNWGIQTDSRCLFCNMADESISHCFFECSFAWDVWKIMAIKCNFNSQRQWHEILIQLRSRAQNKAQRTLLLLSWQATLYSLWMERNNRLHNARSTSSQDLELGNQAYQSAIHICSSQFTPK